MLLDDEHEQKRALEAERKLYRRILYIELVLIDFFLSYMFWEDNGDVLLNFFFGPWTFFVIFTM